MAQQGCARQGSHTGGAAGVCTAGFAHGWRSRGVHGRVRTRVAQQGCARQGSHTGGRRRAGGGRAGGRVAGGRAGGRGGRAAGGRPHLDQQVLVVLDQHLCHEVVTAVSATASCTSALAAVAASAASAWRGAAGAAGAASTWRVAAAAAVIAAAAASCAAAGKGTAAAVEAAGTLVAVAEHGAAAKPAADRPADPTSRANAASLLAATPCLSHSQAAPGAAGPAGRSAGAPLTLAAGLTAGSVADELEQCTRACKGGFAFKRGQEGLQARRACCAVLC